MKSIGKVPINLHVPWAPLRFKANFPLFYSDCVTSSKFIPKFSEILQMEERIFGKELGVFDPMKASFLNDIFEYAGAINPNIPDFVDRLRLSYQLSHILRDGASRLHDYVESLPVQGEKYPIYWKNVKSTSLVPLRQSIANDFFLYRNSYDKIFDLEKKVLSNMSFEEYVWMNSIVNDRSIKLSSSLELVPIFDSFPHSFTANTTATKDGKFISVMSIEDIPEGTPLTRDYGHLDNYAFFIKHGQVLENNPYHFMPFNIDMLPEWEIIVDKLGLSNTQILNRRGNSSGYSMNTLKREIFKKHSQNGIIGMGLNYKPPAYDSEKTLRIVFLNESDMDEMGIKEYSQAVELDFDKMLTQRNERNVRVVMFKCADMVCEILRQGFVGEEPNGEKMEEVDKKIAQSHLDYYKNLISS
ncbi:hypothetical protein SteCoe_8356 [Stentor coeruleus]|uniref:SET domain-containing protein n=1 Tax=Stentor coeruleus TaxID=5963 RepID=A0A1R2CKJ2_9CILI|nr:hypothetical protein SteCoe_8356 [Stentor coeruleus]